MMFFSTRIYSLIFILIFYLSMNQNNQHQTRNASVPVGSVTTSESKSRRYWYYVVFIVLLISTFLGLNALWGLFFIAWTIPAYFNRQIFFIDMIGRDESPIFYWAIFITWIAFGVLMIVGDVPMISQYLGSAST